MCTYDRIFVIGTGRCGTTTFARACMHIRNYNVSHESRREEWMEDLKIGSLEYPPDYPGSHIEVDNRLSWYLGVIGERYGNSPFYVHIKRDLNKTAESFAKRKKSIVDSYAKEFLPSNEDMMDKLDICKHYCKNVNSNINHFLSTKENHMVFRLENAREDFKIFWESISAKGDLDMALDEWDTNYNRSHEKRSAKAGKMSKYYRKVVRIIKNLPKFMRHV